MQERVRAPGSSSRSAKLLAALAPDAPFWGDPSPRPRAWTWPEISFPMRTFGLRALLPEAPIWRLCSSMCPSHGGEAGFRAAWISPRASQVDAHKQSQQTGAATPGAASSSSKSKTSATAKTPCRQGAAEKCSHGAGCRYMHANREGSKREQVSRARGKCVSASACLSVAIWARVMLLEHKLIASYSPMVHLRRRWRDPHILSPSSVMRWSPT